MKNVILWTVIGALVGITLMKVFGPGSATLEDNSGGVACGGGFLYSQDHVTTKDTVKRMEALAKATCSPDDMGARQTTNHRHTDGEYKGELKHAILLE